MKRILYTITASLLLFVACNTNKKSTPEGALVAFYNVENFFDTINTPGVDDIEFTPDGKKEWDSEKYRSKQINMAKVIADIGVDEGFNGPSVIGLCEIENREVLNEFVTEASIADKNYQIVHYDSPDKRGIDVALLYKTDDFQLKKSSVHPLIIHDQETGDRIYTRDQLLVEGLLKGDLVYMIVNHWPSRYGGEERSRPARLAAAQLNRAIIDSILQINTAAKIITMGDLNDDPHNVSVKTGLQACSFENCCENKECTLFNAMEAMHRPDSIGTLKYRGRWNLFDQMILSSGFMDKESSGLKYDTAKIYNKPYLIQQEGKYKGSLLRTYGGRTYLNGYSDHLPVYVLLK